jgi:uncharacterized membrane protein YcaP (DUF421 family)
MEEGFKVFDFHRIFLGDLPISFLAEIIFRTAIMYLYSITLLRLLGKRGMGQLSSLELAIIICFGSAVGDPMIGQNVPIIYGITAITTVALLQVTLEKLINRNKKVEKVLEGSADLLVSNGTIIKEALHRNNLSNADLFRLLRAKGYKYLGEIDKAFFEISGDISVWRNNNPTSSGLILLPAEDIPANAIQVDKTMVEPGKLYSCTECGYTINSNDFPELPVCTSCENKNWMVSGQQNKI